MTNHQIIIPEKGITDKHQQGKLLIYGATGYTGTLIVHENVSEN
jgi:hypothetical protein